MAHLSLFDPDLVEATNLADGVLRSPESPAWPLEGAGSVALERAGAILEGRGERFSPSPERASGT